MKLFYSIILLFICLALRAQSSIGFLPELQQAPSIDGDLAEWKYVAWHDGVWDLHRASTMPWFTPRNTLHDDEEGIAVEDDLRARYYLAWDSEWLYIGAEVWDNVRDVDEPKKQPKRWYYRDALAVFLEAPRDPVPEAFGRGDHGFAFVADTAYPEYGAWWRHGTADSSFLEEPLPAAAVDYRIRNRPEWGGAGYVIEARVNLAHLLPLGDPNAHAPQFGDRYGIMLVHCDPDGAAYGGHLLIYGSGDLDNSWQEFELVGPRVSLRK